MLLHLSLAHYWSRNGRNPTCFGKRKKVIENGDKSKINKYLIFPICFCKRETFYKYMYFTNLMNSKLISELVSSFLCINATQV